MKIESKLIPVTHLSSFSGHGFANGYVGVPAGHPWFGKGYDALDVDIHGGLTYAEDHLPMGEASIIDGLWWVGFDTCHGGDTLTNWNQEACQRELDSLMAQAIAVGALSNA